MKIVINLGFWEIAHLPLPCANINTSSHLGKNVGLGEGQVVTQLVTVRMVPGEGGGGERWKIQT